MKRHALVSISFALLLAAPGNISLAEEATISGEVEAADYDEDGTITDVAIYDEEWGSVLVLPGGKGAQLLSHVGALVTATGEIRELDDDSGYLYGIVVTSYTLDESNEGGATIQ